MTILSPCVFEREAGRPCVVCRSTTGLLADAPEAAPSHPNLAACRQLLTERGLHVFEAEIEGLSDGERRTLEAWAATSDLLPPAYANRAHVVGVLHPGETSRQACTRCGLVLQDHAATVEQRAYPVVVFVGLDCEGHPLTDALVGQETS